MYWHWNVSEVIGSDPFYYEDGSTCDPGNSEIEWNVKLYEICTTVHFSYNLYNTYFIFAYRRFHFNQ